MRRRNTTATGVLAPLAALLLLAAALPLQALADDPDLARLAAEDQAVRAGADDTSSDDARRERVLEILAAGGVLTARDRFHAALVLQHTGLTFCDGELKSLSAENYLLAHFLFKQALADGIKEAAYLAAAAIDRYLGFTRGMQRYGTNRVIDDATGEEMLIPIDRTVTDEERAAYGVPPLQELLRLYRESPTAPTE